MDLILASDRLDFYFQINQQLYEQELEGQVFGSRYIGNGISAQIQDWRKDFPNLEDFGYPSQKKRLLRLRRNYFEQVSHDNAANLFNRKLGDTPYTGAPLSYTTNKIKQTGNLGCIVGGALSWASPNGNSQSLSADFLFRISETVKVLPGDLVFLDRCITYSVPPIMYDKLSEVRLHFAGAFVVPAFFPQLIAMMYKQGHLIKGVKLKNNSFGRACQRALNQAVDYEYRSKWKPQIRILNFFRRTIPESQLSEILQYVEVG